MANTVCPFAVRDRRFGFLMCQKLLDGKPLSNTAEAAEAFCAHQRRCPLTGREENTEAADKCRLRQETS